MLINDRKLVFELPQAGGRRAFIPEGDRLSSDLKSWYGQDKLRDSLDLPNLAELQVIRHYTNLSNKNYGVENGPYPLGSCTMKYNPKINEDVVAMPGFAHVHPMQPDATVQGTLKALYHLEELLCDLTGMDGFTLQPSAGAHGEYAGVMLIKSYHQARNDEARQYILVPDSAHGTNPATAAMAGYEIREVKSLPNGEVDVEDLKSKCDETVAGMMLTNPNTLGLFETQVKEITQAVHDCGGLMYYDGANLNPIMMQVRPGDMGFDCVHLNVHKTLSTPHGGGGPGAGPVGCKDFLKPYLPKPVLAKEGDKYFWDYDRPESFGRVRSFNGATAVLLRALSYLMANGYEGLKDSAEAAVANANYLYGKLKDLYATSTDQPVMHEFVLSGDIQAKQGCNTMDMAKRMIDYGIHPPTVYFPLIVHEAMMFEPTDTETVEGMQKMVHAMQEIAKEVENNPDLIHAAPHHTPVRRPDEVKAAKDLVVKFEG